MSVTLLRPIPQRQQKTQLIYDDSLCQRRINKIRWARNCYPRRGRRRRRRPRLKIQLSTYLILSEATLNT